MRKGDTVYTVGGVAWLVIAVCAGGDLACHNRDRGVVVWRPCCVHLTPEAAQRRTS